MQSENGMPHLAILRKQLEEYPFSERYKEIEQCKEKERITV
jgi:hypothetical protein